jgi:predicted DNA-binding WGR domain protein
MSDWTVHLEFEEGTSSKFWRARVEGKTLYVNYGKIGANGQTQVKEFGDPAAARAEYDKLVREKRKKGYQEAGARSEGAADDDGDRDDESDEGKAGDEDRDEDDEPPPARKATTKPATAKPAAGRTAGPAASSPPGHRLVLDAGGRKVETTLYLDGATVRMDSRETYASGEAATKAFERLKRILGGEGYKAG